jgi:uncharacterized protein with PIN domain
MVIDNGPPSFICDDNLGKLARLLRAAGCDTLFFEKISDGELISTALRDRRYLITRDHNLVNKGADADRLVVIEADDPDEQMKFVIKMIGLAVDRDNWMSRCLECNTLLSPVEKNDIADRVPPYVYKTHDEFRFCPQCEKIFWKGTHHQRLVERIAKAFGESGL